MSRRRSLTPLAGLVTFVCFVSALTVHPSASLASGGSGGGGSGGGSGGGGSGGSSGGGGSATTAPTTKVENKGDSKTTTTKKDDDETATSTVASPTALGTPSTSKTATTVAPVAVTVAADDDIVTAPPKSIAPVVVVLPVEPSTADLPASTTARTSLPPPSPRTAVVPTTIVRTPSPTLSPATATSVLRTTHRCAGANMRLELGLTANVRVKTTVTPTGKSSWTAIVLQDRKIVWRGKAESGRIDTQFRRVSGSQTISVRLTSSTGMVCAADLTLPAI